MSNSSLFDYNDWTTYKNAKPDTDKLYDNVIKLSTLDYKNHFKNVLFYKK